MWILIYNNNQLLETVILPKLIYMMLPSLPNTTISYLFFLPFFLGPHLRHMEIPRIGVKLEL